jgi:transcription-repair coupling factor (superfamily II helicase)
VLVVAESAGRRESLMELLRDHRIDLPSVDTLDAFVCGDHRPRHHGRRWPGASSGMTAVRLAQASSSSQRRSCSTTPATRRRRKTEQATASIRSSRI